MFEELFQRALLAYRNENYTLSTQLALQCLSEDPQHRNSLQLVALSYYRKQEIQPALSYFEQLAQLYPDASIFNNIGLLYKQLRKNLEAKEFYERAIQYDNNFSVAYFNLANLYRDMGNPQQSIEFYSKACQLQPNFAEAWLNLGNAYKETYQYLRALNCYQSSLQYNNNYTEAYLNVGIIYLLMQDYSKSLSFLQKALSLQPNSELAQIYLFCVQTQICDWDDYAHRLQQLKTICEKEVVEKKPSAIEPFFALRFDLDDKVILSIARNYVQNATKKNDIELQDFHCHTNSKLKIAYISSDIKNHPVGHLLCDLLPQHNREQFEIVVFSHGSDEHNEVRSKIIANADNFLDVTNISDIQAAQFINQHSINILVDLNGLTRGSRLGILAQKPAPIQACHLGYPATIGAQFIDYLYADNHTIKAENLDCYSEKIIFLPHTWQTHQFKYTYDKVSISRDTFGIPENSFVYCCFNNNYKIEPGIFKIWMEILAKTSNSVLWLLSHSQLVITHLRKQASLNGIKPQRLIFCPPTDRKSYLARYLLCDLFLDTFVYNAHATAADALSMGLPILTLEGKTFRSRVAMSYLSALDLTELIAQTPASYIDKAIYFYHHRQALHEVHEKIIADAATSPLFDMNNYTRNLEKSFQMIWQNYLQNKLPQNFWIND